MSETESDDEEPFLRNNNRKFQLNEEIKKLKRDEVGRKGLRQRSLNQSLRIHPVAKNGHCLYIAILSATKNLDLLPGNLFTDKSMKNNVLRMRLDMIAYLDRGVGPVVQSLRETLLLPRIRARIRAGITSTGTLKATVGYNEWAGDEEIRILQKMYDIDLVILRKDDAIRGAIGNRNIRPSTAILVYTGNHYEWATVKNWSTMMMKPPSQINIKF